MGNCLVLENKVIKIVRADGKVLEYRGPMKVHQILSQFSGHTLSDALSNTDHDLQPDAKLLAGRLYYLRPWPGLPPSPKPKDKKVRFAIPEIEEQEQEQEKRVLDKEEEDNNVSVVRIKIVVSKQELQKLIQGGSIHDMVYQSLDKQELIGNPMGGCDNGDHGCKRGWKPELDSILE